VAGWGPTVLRFVVGLTFVAHGVETLMPVWGWTPNPAAAILPAQGLGADSLIVVLVGTLYVAGGLALVAGAFTTVAATTLAVERVISLWYLHLGNGFFLNWTLTTDLPHGSEYHLLSLAALLCLAFEGGGEFSVDALRSERAEAMALGRARLRTGKLR